MKKDINHPYLNPGRPIQWSQLGHEHIEADITIAIADAKRAIADICRIKTHQRTFENTVAALEEALQPLEQAWALVCHLSSVKDSKELRDAHNKMLPKVSDFHSSIPQNKKLWQAIKDFSASSAARKLAGIRKRLLSEFMMDFEINGADLPNAKKLRLRKINAALTRTTRIFTENVMDATNAWEYVITDETKLKGLPDSARTAAWESAGHKGLHKEGRKVWRFTLHAPSMLAVMQHLDDADIRHIFYAAQSNIGRQGKHNNLKLIKKTLDLRDEKARLLGFKTFADLVLKRRMAGTGRKALSFVDNMHSKTRSKFQRENKALAAFAASACNSTLAPLPPWSILYWAEKMQKERYDIDNDKIREYFGIDDVMKGMFKIASRLFSINIQKKRAETWHDSVKYYEILDAKDGRLMGTFYLDLYPRESKHSGAWMAPIIVGGPSAKGFIPHTSSICGNMSPPLGKAQARITHDEMTTLFHEFGHLLHSILSEVEFASLAGTNVAWDFVELPSQLLENWCWNAESLKILSKHKDSGKPIDDATITRMLKARNFRSSYACTRQLAYAKMDLELHMKHPKYRGIDFDALHRRLLKSYSSPSPTAPKSFLFSFQHIFSSPVGYAAGYYSYKWAQCLEADVFSRFARNGIMDTRTGMKLRTTILSKGNSKQANDIFRDFMGRDPDPDALLKRDNLVP